jgi:hypothetical protein
VEAGNCRRAKSTRIRQGYGIQWLVPLDTKIHVAAFPVELVDDALGLLLRDRRVGAVQEVFANFPRTQHGQPA